MVFVLPAVCLCRQTTQQRQGSRWLGGATQTGLTSCPALHQGELRLDCANLPQSESWLCYRQGLWRCSRLCERARSRRSGTTSRWTWPSRSPPSRGRCRPRGRSTSSWPRSGALCAAIYHVAVRAAMKTACLGLLLCHAEGAGGRKPTLSGCGGLKWALRANASASRTSRSSKSNARV